MPRRRTATTGGGLGIGTRGREAVAVGAQVSIRLGRWGRAARGVGELYARAREKRGRSGMRSKLTGERAAEAPRLVAEGLTLDAVAERLGVNRRTILRWVERDPAFRQRYEQARRAAHEGLHRELLEAIIHAGIHAGGARAAAHAARRRLMRRAPKRYGRLPPEQRPHLLYRPRPRRAG
jgi:transcriptional regulator with XRE-family HTH domain